MIQNHSKKLAILLAGTSLLMTAGSASLAGTAKSKGPSPKEAQAIRNARKQIQALQILDQFEMRYGNSFVIEEAKAAWRQRMERELDLLPESQAYADGDVCLVAGWPGNYRSGTCRMEGDAKAKAADTLTLRYLFCGATDKITCNPALFGRVESPTLPSTLESSTPPAKTSPVCVARSEPRMTMACLRTSLSAAGVEIPSEAKTDISKFDPSKLSDGDVKKWTWFLNGADGETSTFTALDAVNLLCSSLAQGDYRTQTSAPLAREQTESLKAQLSKDPKRAADLADCKKVQALVNKAQVPVATPIVTDSAGKPEPTSEGHSAEVTEKAKEMNSATHDYKEAVGNEAK